MYQCQLGRSQPKEKGWTSAALVMTAEMSDMEVEVDTRPHLGLDIWQS